MADFSAVICKLRLVHLVSAAKRSTYSNAINDLEKALKQGNGKDAASRIRKIKDLLPSSNEQLKKQLLDLEKECPTIKKTGHVLAQSELTFQPSSENERRLSTAEKKQKQITTSSEMKRQPQSSPSSGNQRTRLLPPTPSKGEPKQTHGIQPKKEKIAIDLKSDLKMYSKKVLSPEENKDILKEDNQRDCLKRIIHKLEYQRDEANHHYDELVGQVQKLNSLIVTSTKHNVNPTPQSDLERLEASIMWLIETFHRASATKNIAIKAEQKKAGSKVTEIWVTKLDEKVKENDFKFFSQNDVRDESQRNCLNKVLKALSFQSTEIDTKASELAETKSKLDDFKKSVRLMRKEMFDQDDHVDVTGSVEKCKAEVLELHKHLLKQMQRMTDELQQLDATKATPAERKPSSKRNNDDIQMVCSQFKECFKNTDMLLKRLQKRCFREEIGSFDNEIDHWSDLIEVEHKEGLDSEFCVALRRLREKTFKRKKQCLLISENMRIADDELKQLQTEVIEWEQLGTVDNLQNPKNFPLAFAVNETRIEIVNIKKRQQGSFEAKMKVFKSLCKYILDEEVKQKGGEPISSEEPDAEACFSCIQRWKEDRQNTQRFFEEIYPLLQSSLTSLKSEPYLFHEPKKRKDVKLYSKFCADVQICVHQLVDYIKFNAERFATSYIDFSKAVRLLGEHYSALTSEQYQMPKKETSYEIIIQNITDRLVQLGITKRQITVLVDEKNSLALRRLFFSAQTLAICKHIC
ncbi:hypothetical protein MAR_023894 [Mya arenaria]|uniref:Uncharacterized protein n=1 Tax=Mya arenaria TaxID=6604 RepID=A0ABY7DRL2_MYAAR|nr:hypothetical protein MAR_023894 [Mya arenaria]